MRLSAASALAYAALLCGGKLQDFPHRLTSKHKQPGYRDVAKPCAPAGTQHPCYTLHSTASPHPVLKSCIKSLALPVEASTTPHTASPAMTPWLFAPAQAANMKMASFP